MTVGIGNTGKTIGTNVSSLNHTHAHNSQGGSEAGMLICVMWDDSSAASDPSALLTSFVWNDASSENELSEWIGAVGYDLGPAQLIKIRTGQFVAVKFFLTRGSDLHAVNWGNRTTDVTATFSTAVDDVAIYSINMAVVNNFIQNPLLRFETGVATADGATNPSVNTVDSFSQLESKDLIVQFHVKGSAGGDFTAPVAASFTDQEFNDGADWLSGMSTVGNPFADSSSMSYTGSGTQEDGGSVFFWIDGSTDPVQGDSPTLGGCIGPVPTHEYTFSDHGGMLTSYVAGGAEATSSWRRRGAERSTTDFGEILYRRPGPSDILPFAVNFNGNFDSGFDITTPTGVSGSGGNAWARHTAGTSVIVIKADHSSPQGGYVITTRNTGLEHFAGWRHETPNQTGGDGLIKISFLASGSNGPTFSYQNSIFNTTQWVTVVFAQPGTGSAWKMYVQGIDVTSSVVQSGGGTEDDFWGTNSFSGASPGHDYGKTDNAVRAFVGDIACLAEYTEVLTPEEIFTISECILEGAPVADTGAPAGFGRNKKRKRQIAKARVANMKALKATQKANKAAVNAVTQGRNMPAQCGVEGACLDWDEYLNP